MAGRKTKYTPETVAKLTQAIRLGATYVLACNYAGISEETFSQWRNNKPEFSEAIKEAEGTGAVLWLGKIEQAASDGNWQAAAWKLERRYPEMYGKRALDITSGGQAIKGYIGISPDDWDKRDKTQADDE